MHTKYLKIYQESPKDGVNNEYPTSHNAFRQPCLQMIVGQRATGKSYLTSKILAQAHKEKTFDRIYIITPSFNSNIAYFGKYIKTEDVFNPTRDSIDKVISNVEIDRNLWEKFVKEKQEYKRFQQKLNAQPALAFTDDEMLHAFYKGWFEAPPKWHYEKEEPPKSLLIMDDVLSSPAISQSSGLTRVATLNRHIAPLETPHSGRSACGLAVIILSQSYRMQSGISRVLRENLSLLTLFKNKQEKQMEAIKEELANVVDTHLFEQAYEYATRDKHGNLTVDFRAKCPTLTFRKKLNEAILFDELKCDCKK